MKLNIKNRLKIFFHYFISKCYIYYIQFVCLTSVIRIRGRKELFLDARNNKYIFGYWHGDSSALYVLLKKAKNNISMLTTEDERGNYISFICNYFRCGTIRLPDETRGGNYLFKVKNRVNNSCDLGISLDGPIGPYHKPKVFPFVLALMLNRAIIPITIKVRFKYNLKKRWDKYMLFFPFNGFEIEFHEPVEVVKEDLKSRFKDKVDRVKKTLEFN